MDQRFDHDRVARDLGEIAAEAGRYLASVPDRAAGRVLKDDGSPATAADLESERLILARLCHAYPRIDVVAEEGRREREGTGLFFLVDPLDGTKDYLTGSGEYSVNIALVAGDRPVAAALAAPTLDRVWIAGRAALVADMSDASATLAWTAVTSRASPNSGLVALVSRRHGDPDTERCLAAFTVAETRTVSSAAKFGLLASGEADLYIRCGATMEWDTAAGDHILVRAGGVVVGPDRRPLTYGHSGRGFRNGAFAAMGDPTLAARTSLPKSY